MSDGIEELQNPWRPADPHVLDALNSATVERLRLLQDSSNYVFLADIAHPEHGPGLGVYKPQRGESPLADFPGGTLHLREIAAYEFSRLLGWDLVPPTVAIDGPQGPGSLQLFIEHDPGDHYFKLRHREQFHDHLRRFAAFDLLANNADRKGGHLLLDADGALWAIDNALCFHRVEKLRTVIWDFAGSDLPDRWLADIERARNCLQAADDSTAALRDLISPSEVEALIERSTALLQHPVLPEMYPWRCVPWPLI